jgi:hypothetical protein
MGSVLSFLQAKTVTDVEKYFSHIRDEIRKDVDSGDLKLEDSFDVFEDVAKDEKYMKFKVSTKKIKDMRIRPTFKRSKSRRVV